MGSDTRTGSIPVAGTAQSLILQGIEHFLFEHLLNTLLIIGVITPIIIGFFVGVDTTIILVLFVGVI